MMMIVAITACAVCLVMALVRTALGPTAFDRVLAVNAIGTLVILGIALHGFIMERPEFVDIDEAKTGPSRFLVHALHPQFGDDVRSGDMDQRNCALEGVISGRLGKSGK